MTHSPAIIAFVVAIAGMILPAICLISNFDLVEMLKMSDLRLAAAATRSSVSSSSLSKAILGPDEPTFKACACESRKRLAKRCRLSLNTAKFSLRDQVI